MNFTSYIPSLKSQFLRKMGYHLNLENPTTLSEKLNYLKIYDTTDLKTLCSDKFKVRDYVKNKLNEDISIPLIGAYDSVDQIDFSVLPKRYVIKCNHGSGMNLVINDCNYSVDFIKSKLNEWLKKDFIQYHEYHYAFIKKKILIEEFICEENEVLTDYKFWCFNGKPEFMYISDDGSNDPHTDFFDMNFNHLDISMRDPNHKVIPNKPKNFEKMKEFSTILSKDFKFVRVDFYEYKEKLYFGELTFYPNAGYLHYRSKNYDLEFGSKLKL